MANLSKSQQIDLLYQSFTKSAIGEDINQWCQMMYDDYILKAQQASDPQEAFGFLKKAAGIMEVMLHIKSRADQAPQAQ